MNILQKILSAWFRRKISLTTINRHLFKLQVSDVQQDKISSRKIKISCIQREIVPMSNIEEYIDLIHKYVKIAVNNQCQLIVFPEYNFIDLLGMIPGFKVLNRYLTYKARTSQKLGQNSKLQAKDSWKSFDQSRTNHNYPNLDQDISSKEFLSPAWIFRAMADPVARGLERIYSYFAECYAIYIYTGSYLCLQEGVLYNVGALYGPDGKQVGKQKKLHLTKLEAGFGMGKGVSIEVYDLPIGKVALPICMDATYFETFRIIREKGADLVILPIANPEDYNPWKALKGLWPRVQESYVVGLKASLNGWLAGIHYTGKAGIFAPIPMTPGKDGILHLASHYEGDQVITEEIDFSQLVTVREQAEYYGDRNLDFEKDYVQRTYFSLVKKGG